MTAQAPPSPGSVLRDLLDAKQISQIQASKTLGISRGHLNAIINDHKPVSAEIKLKLQDLLQIPLSHWSRVQQQHDLYLQTPEGQQTQRLQQQSQIIDQLLLNSRSHLLSHEIQQATESQWLGIHPFHPDQLAPTGYWFTLGLTGILSRLTDPNPNPTETEVQLKPHLKLQPGEVLIVLSHEKLQLPGNLEASLLAMDDSFNTPALRLYCRQQFDPGLNTSVTFHIHNASGRPQLLEFRQQAVQLRFHYTADDPPLHRLQT